MSPRLSRSFGVMLLLLLLASVSSSNSYTASTGHLLRRAQDDSTQRGRILRQEVESGGAATTEAPEEKDEDEEASTDDNKPKHSAKADADDSDDTDSDDATSDKKEQSSKDEDAKKNQDDATPPASGAQTGPASAFGYDSWEGPRMFAPQAVWQPDWQGYQEQMPPWAMQQAPLPPWAMQPPPMMQPPWAQAPPPGWMTQPPGWMPPMPPNGPQMQPPPQQMPPQQQPPQQMLPQMPPQQPQFSQPQQQFPQQQQVAPMQAGPVLASDAVPVAAPQQPAQLPVAQQQQQFQIKGTEAAQPAPQQPPQQPPPQQQQQPQQPPQQQPPQQQQQQQPSQQPSQQQQQQQQQLPEPAPAQRPAVQQPAQRQAASGYPQQGKEQEQRHSWYQSSKAMQPHPVQIQDASQPEPQQQQQQQAQQQQPQQQHQEMSRPLPVTPMVRAGWREGWQVPPPQGFSGGSGLVEDKQVDTTSRRRLDEELFQKELLTADAGSVSGGKRIEARLHRLEIPARVSRLEQSGASPSILEQTEKDSAHQPAAGDLSSKDLLDAAIDAKDSAQEAKESLDSLEDAMKETPSKNQTRGEMLNSKSKRQELLKQLQDAKEKEEEAKKLLTVARQKARHDAVVGKGTSTSVPLKKTNTNVRESEDILKAISVHPSVASASKVIGFNPVIGAVELDEGTQDSDNDKVGTGKEDLASNGGTVAESYGYVVDGCQKKDPDGDTDFESQLFSMASTAKVRCCSSAGTSCTSFPQGESSSCFGSLNYTEASSVCTGAGLRLCTKDELEARICCNTGCGFDDHLVWSSTTPGAMPAEWKKELKRLMSFHVEVSEADSITELWKADGDIWAANQALNEKKLKRRSFVMSKPSAQREASDRCQSSCDWNTIDTWLTKCSWSTCTECTECTVFKEESKNQTGCCDSDTADCLSCKMALSLPDFCSQFRKAPGCEILASLTLKTRVSRPIEQGATRLQVDDVDGLRKGTELQLSSGSLNETVVVDSVSTTGSLLTDAIARAAGVVILEGPVVNAWPVGAVVSFAAPSMNATNETDATGATKGIESMVPVCPQGAITKFTLNLKTFTDDRKCGKENTIELAAEFEENSSFCWKQPDLSLRTLTLNQADNAIPLGSLIRIKGMAFKVIGKAPSGRGILDCDPLRMMDASCTSLVTEFGLEADSESKEFPAELCPPQSTVKEAYALEPSMSCGHTIGNCSSHNPLPIGKDSQVYDVTSKEKVMDECGALCDSNDECGGFNFEASTSRCYYMKSTTCNQVNDTDRDCYTKNGGDEMKTVDFDLTIDSIEFDKLKASPMLKSAFTTAIIQSVQNIFDVGDFTISKVFVELAPADQDAASLLSGASVLMLLKRGPAASGVKVQVKVQPSALGEPEKIMTALVSKKSSGTLAQKVLRSIKGVPGIQMVANGLIRLKQITTPKLSASGFSDRRRRTVVQPGFRRRRRASVNSVPTTATAFKLGKVSDLNPKTAIIPAGIN